MLDTISVHMRSEVRVSDLPVFCMHGATVFGGADLRGTRVHYLRPSQASLLSQAIISGHYCPCAWLSQAITSRCLTISGHLCPRAPPDHRYPLLFPGGGQGPPHGYCCPVQRAMLWSASTTWPSLSTAVCHVSTAGISSLCNKSRLGKYGVIGRVARECLCK